MSTPSMPLDLYGISPISRSLLQLYIVYLAIFKNFKITSWYFFIYSLINLLMIRRIYFLANKDKKYLQIHDRKSIWQLPIFIETVASFVINMIAFIILTTRN
jgi:hypothetical protein